MQLTPINRHRIVAPLLWLLLISLTLVDMVCAQAVRPGPSSNHAILYRRAVALLDQAEKKLNTRSLAEAKAAAKEANSLFSLLQKELSQWLTEREFTPKDEQQFAINEKLGQDAHSQADLLMKSAADHEKKGQYLEAQKQEDRAQASFRQAKQDYDQAQYLYVKALIYSLRNQQMIFGFLDSSS